jgi:hypothetical protein
LLKPQEIIEVCSNKSGLAGNTYSYHAYFTGKNT